MADFTYNNWFERAYDGSGDNLANGGDTIKIALLTSAYTPDRDTHDFFDDLTNEVVGTGYVAGGATIANQSWVQNDTLDKAVYNGDPVEWPGSTITARYGVVYKDTGTPGTSPLIQLLDFGGDQSTSGSTFKITPDANGYFRLGNP